MRRQMAHPQWPYPGEPCELCRAGERPLVVWPDGAHEHGDEPIGWRQALGIALGGMFGGLGLWCVLFFIIVVGSR